MKMKQKIHKERSTVLDIICDLPEMVSKREGFINLLKEYGYAETSLTKARRIITALTKYMQDNAINEYSADVYHQFLETRFENKEVTDSTLAKYLLCLERFDSFVSGDEFIYHTAPSKSEFNWFKEELEAFRQYNKENGNLPITIEKKERNLLPFLDGLVALGVYSLSSITEDAIRL